MPQLVDLLRLLPDLATIGKPKLQAYCGEWLQRPIAHRFGITHLIVGSDLMLTVVIDENRATFHDNHVFIPIDELAGYIIDRHFEEADQRCALHAELRAFRDRWGERGYQYEVMDGRVGFIWFTCKNPGCGSSVRTGQQAVEGQSVSMPPVEVTCPFCRVTSSYDGSDLYLKLAEE